MTHAPRAGAVAFILACACSNNGAPSTTTAKTSLQGRAIARIGSDEVGQELVVRVAAAQNIFPREAAARLIDDALAAEYARREAIPDRSADVRVDTSKSLARSVAAEIRKAADAVGAPNAAEIEHATAAHWTEVDIDEQVKVIFALVLRPKAATAAQLKRAPEIAADLQRNLRDAPNEEAFIQASSAAKYEGFEVITQDLQFVEDGRLSETNNLDPRRVDTTFVRAAFALRVGQTSGVVETPFGWHILRLTARIPPKHLSVAERSARFESEILVERARKLYETRLAALRAKTKVEMAADAEQQMQIAVSPPRREP